MHLITESGGSPGEGNGYPFQYSCLESSMDRGAWWATVHEVLMSIGLEARLLTLNSYPDINCISWISNFVVAVQLLSHVQLFVIPWTTAYQASLSFTISWSLLKLVSTESMMPFNHLILCCPLLLLPSIFPSIMIFSNESGLCIRWPKYWSFSFSISPSNEYLGLISFKIDWFDLLAFHGILKSLFQHHNSKASIFQCSAFFMFQVSHPYMTTGKAIALTRWTFVGKVIIYQL